MPLVNTGPRERQGRRRDIVNIDTVSGRVLVRVARAHGRAVTVQNMREAQRLARLFVADGADEWRAAEAAAVLALRIYALPVDVVSLGVHR